MTTTKRKPTAKAATSKPTFPEILERIREHNAEVRVPATVCLDPAARVEAALLDERHMEARKAGEAERARELAVEAKAAHDRAAAAEVTITFRRDGAEWRRLVDRHTRTKVFDERKFWPEALAAMCADQGADDVEMWTSLRDSLGVEWDVLTTACKVANEGTRGAVPLSASALALSGQSSIELAATGGR